MKTTTKINAMLHGGDYNPDQWADCPEVLSEDIRLMKLAGINAVSLGIFAWAKLEPEEGKFDFSFFDSVIDNLYNNGIYTLLATPSGARPAWLAKKYPEVLRTRADRQRILFSERHNHCYTSPIYREKVRIINTKLAEHYKDHPGIIAWHISNEYGGECHCELCRAAFREWLKDKYDNDLDKLNKQWWTAFWSHTYTDWEQIDAPTNPYNLGEQCVHGLVLDWKRFVTHQTMDFIKNETKPLKRITPNIPVTTNFMYFFDQLDYSKMKDVVDFVSWDSYPEWHNPTIGDKTVACTTAFMHDSMRSYLGKPFILMESTPSHVNWKLFNKLKRPNMHKTSSLQAVAHGSDSVMYFQWRKSRGSSEKLHGAVVDHVGNENTRVFREVAELGECLKGLGEVVGSETKSEAAIIYDYDNRMAIREAQSFQRENKKYTETLVSHYYPFWKNGVCVDVIDSEYAFDKYKIIIMPMLYMIKPGVEDKIEKFVANGGTAVMTYMSGMVNENDLCCLGGFPAGKLKDVFGIWAEEIDTLYENEERTVTYDGQCFTIKDYCEVVHPTTAKVLAEYNEDFYAGNGAIFENEYKKGKAYYIACRDTGEMTARLYEKIISACKPNGAPKAQCADGVVLTLREDDDNKYVFVQNYTPDKQSAVLETDGAIDMESGTVQGREIILDSYGSKVLKFKK